MASALCKHKSEIFQGHCVLHVRCNYRCQKLENAAFGLCQRSGLSGKECHCYFNECPQTSTTGEVHSNGTTTYEEAKTVFYEIHD
uniref:Defensin 4 n=1 Tax=Datisca glomerata TaxID=34297 RepID=A0A6M3RPK1_DATGL|nr:defensin 4 [Datisca glomerata]